MVYGVALKVEGLLGVGLPSVADLIPDGSFNDSVNRIEPLPRNCLRVSGEAASILPRRV